LQSDHAEDARENYYFMSHEGAHFGDFGEPEKLVLKARFYV
jgi:hypothetical protein